MFSESTVRQTLIQVLNGPDQLVVDDLGSAPADSPVKGADFFSGWRVLHLEVWTNRLTRDEYQETRTIYANWGASQRPKLPVAVLRAAHRSRAYVNSLLNQPEPSIAIPARFAWIPLDQVKDWISAVTHLSVLVGEPENWDEPEQRRRLLVDLRWTDHMFDKRWGTSSNGHDVINRCWQQVWEHMDDLLRTAVPLSKPMRLEESFRASGNPESPYHYVDSAFDSTQ